MEALFKSLPIRLSGSIVAIAGLLFTAAIIKQYPLLIDPGLRPGILVLIGFTIVVIIVHFLTNSRSFLKTFFLSLFLTLFLMPFIGPSLFGTVPKF